MIHLHLSGSAAGCCAARANLARMRLIEVAIAAGLTVAGDGGRLAASSLAGGGGPGRTSADFRWVALVTIAGPANAAAFRFRGGRFGR